MIRWDLLLSSLLLIGSIPSFDASAEYSIRNGNKSECLPPQTSYRKGSEDCWVRFRDQNGRFVCVPRVIWKTWLASSDFQFCFDSKYKWKTASPPKNDKNLPKKKITYFRTVFQFILGIDPNKAVASIQTWTFHFLKILESLREKISEKLADSDPLGISRSLLLNEQSSSPRFSILRRLGFVHVITSSGIHLWTIGSMIQWTLGVITKHLQFPVRTGIHISRFVSAGTCLFIWMLSGARIGMLRPVFVLALHKSGSLLGVKWRIGSPLFLAILMDRLIEIILSYFREAPSSGFGRAYYTLAIAGGILGRNCLRAKHFGMALGSWIGVALWETQHLSTISVATPIFSLICIPVICYAVYPVFILSIFFGILGENTISEALLCTSSKGFNSFTSLLADLSLHSGNLWIIDKSLVLQSIVVGFFLSSIYLANRLSLGKRIATIGLAFSILLVARFFLIKNNHPFEIAQLDVSQGDAALVLNKQVGLVDSGPELSISEDAWITIFASNGVHRIDWIGLTHLDEDHAGGILRISNLLPIGCIAVPSSELITRKGKKLSHFLKERKIQVFDWNSTCIPYPTLSIQNKSDSSKTHRPRANANMGVVFIPLSKGGFYLNAGDADSKQEKFVLQWVSQFEELKTATFNRILKVSHHGSHSSSSFLWLKTIQPTQAWISAGTQNHYGHPAIQVLNRLLKLRIPIRRTDQEGMILIN